jgi:hypothetical protein
MIKNINILLNIEGILTLILLNIINKFILNNSEMLSDSLYSITLFGSINLIGAFYIKSTFFEMTSIKNNILKSIIFYLENYSLLFLSHSLILKILFIIFSQDSEFVDFLIALSSLINIIYFLIMIYTANWKIIT